MKLRGGMAEPNPSTVLPKLSFENCDETSLTLKWDANIVTPLLTGPQHYHLTIQYKEIHETWEQARQYSAPVDQSELNLTHADIVDLKPGTPYFVRLALHNNQNGTVLLGPETVFDTRPVDCTPKRKRCIIS